MPYYKYVVPERIDVLQNLKIRFTQPSALNDPFEAFPAVRTQFDRRQTKQYARQRVRRVIRGVDVGARRKRSVARELHRDFVKFCDESVGDKGAEDLQRRARAVCDCLGLLLCLSKVPDNILMWSHYASSHQGFVIELDSDHEFFRFATQEVVYSTQRPTWNVKDARHPAGMEHTKSIDWAYEQEVRMTEMVGGKEAQLEKHGEFIPAPPDCEPDRHSIHLFDIPKDLITGVIVGWKSDKSLMSSLRDVVERQKLRRVKLRKAVPSKTEFKMEIVSLKI